MMLIIIHNLLRTYLIQIAVGCATCCNLITDKSALRDGIFLVKLRGDGVASRIYRASKIQRERTTCQEAKWDRKCTVHMQGLQAHYAS